MSCPTATQCTVVGDNNDETTFNPQTAGTVNAVPIASSGSYGAISCWSATQCTTVGGGGEVTFNPQLPNSPTPAPHATIDTTPGVDLVSVSCPAATQCTAVDGTSGNEVTFDPTNPAPQAPTVVDTHGNLTSITCPDTGECVTVDTAGWAATFTPTSGAVTLSQEVGLANRGTNVFPSLHDVSCVPNADQCSASASNGSVATFDPTDANGRKPEFLSAARYNGMACPTASLCLTASTNAGLVSFDPQVGGVPTLAHLGVLAQGPIVCVSAAQCTASTGVGATTFDPAGAGSITDIDFTPGVTAMSCPTTTGCSFGDMGGNFLSVTPQSNSLAGADVAGGSILAVSCPSGTQCTVAQANGYLRTFDPGTVGASTLKYATASAQVTAVDCPNVTVCAVGESNGFATTFDPQTHSLPQGTYRLDAGEALSGISCADATHCVAVDAAGAETSFNPQLPRNLVPVTVDPGTALVAVSCPTDAQCTAIDGLGQEVTFDPSAAAGATPVSIDADNALGAISCPEATECVAVDSDGQSLAGNPQDPNTPWDVQPIPGTAALTAISCPSSDECSAVDSSGEYSLGSFVAAPASTDRPTISGPAVVGQTLTETHATWSGSPTAYAYQWEDCDANGLSCEPITDAVQQSYTAATGDTGDTLRLVETAYNAGGPGVPATSDPTSLVVEPSSPTPSTTTSASSTTTATTPPPVITKHLPAGAQVRAALHHVLAPSGARARIKALLKAGGYTLTFDAPSAGRLSLAWYLVPKGARLTDARTAKPVLVASVSARITRAGKVRVKVKLSRAGRTRLKSAQKSLKLTGQGSFTPSGAKRTTVRRSFAIRR